MGAFFIWMSWDQYFQKNKGRSVRPLYVKAMGHLSDFQSDQSVAVDLGCGAGIETVDLLKRGWSVFAIDGEPAAISAVNDFVGESLSRSLRTICSRFEDLKVIPPSAFLFSYHSLPFCHPDHLDRIWKMIEQSIAPRGVFAGSFFGSNDEWVQSGRCTGISQEKLKVYLAEFDLLHLEEIDEVGTTALGGAKHWHVIDVIAKKKCP